MNDTLVLIQSSDGRIDDTVIATYDSSTIHAHLKTTIVVPDTPVKVLLPDPSGLEIFSTWAIIIGGYADLMGAFIAFYQLFQKDRNQQNRETFANDLKKMLPRIPLVEDVRDFWSFSNAGRKLAKLHINYERVAPYDGVIVTGAEKLSFIDTEPADTKLYLVEKMRFPKKGQKDTIIYNSRITIGNILEKAYEYVVNGKSAIEWIMERYAVTTHKESGIRNDPNDWSTEVGNPRYILDLLLSIINVSVQTVEIVEGLPEVRWE